MKKRLDTDQARAKNKVLRVLMLIDALSQMRLPFTIQDARHKLEERSGSKCALHDRTIKRDMDLLILLNFAHVYRKHKPIGLGSKAGSLPVQYKMNLTLTTNVQRAAAKARSLTAHSWHDGEQSPRQPNFQAPSS